MARPASPLGVGFRLRLMLTLTAVAVFPIACVSYVIVRDEVRNVTRSIDFEVRDAAQATQARFARLLDRRQLHALEAASSPRLQTAILRHNTKRLEQFARQNGLLLDVRGRRFGRRLEDAVTARVQLVSRGKTIGSVVAQLPADAATLRRVSAPAAQGVRLTFVGLGGGQPAQGGHGATLPLAKHVGIRAYLPGSVGSHRKNAAYKRVAEAGLLALAALMLLTLILARPLLRASAGRKSRRTRRESTPSPGSRIGALSKRSSPPRSPAPIVSRISSRSSCSISTASKRSTTPSVTRPAT